MSLSDLESHCDAVLISSLRPKLKAAIDDAMAKGATKADILRSVGRVGGKSLTWCAVSAYLASLPDVPNYHLAASDMPLNLEDVCDEQ